MTSGQAHGSALEYEGLCKAIIQELNKEEKWEPWIGDGIGERFKELDEMLNAKITFDIALKNLNSKVMVGECRKIKKPIKQSDIFGLYGKLICLRKALNSDGVNGVFVTSSKYQEGAILVAHHLGIRLAECMPNQSAQSFRISFLRPNPEKRRRPFRDHNVILTTNIEIRDAVGVELNPEAEKESTAR